MQEGRLNSLQWDFLQAFFKRDSHFFLTGGAALAGFHLHHRPTEDLDLFTLGDHMTEGSRVVADTARGLGALMEPIQSSPDFRRFLLRRGSEAIIVDLVHEYTRQVFSEKPVINGIRVDPPGEIMSNKLCALLSRSEIRDLVDVRALESAGYRVEDWLESAASKDTGLTPAQLGWVLREIKLGDDLIPPGGVSLGELRVYLSELVTRLGRLAYPRGKDGAEPK